MIVGQNCEHMILNQPRHSYTKIKVTIYADICWSCYFSGELTFLFWLEHLMQKLVSFCQTNVWLVWDLVIPGGRPSRLRLIFHRRATAILVQLKIQVSDCGSVLRVLWTAVDTVLLEFEALRRQLWTILINFICEANNHLVKIRQEHTWKKFHEVSMWQTPLRCFGPSHLQWMWLSLAGYLQE